METTPAFARPFAPRPLALAWLGCFALLALAIYAAVALLQPIVAAIAGAGGLALLRWARAERPYSAALIAIDAAAFAIFAIQRNDSLGFWQLPGPWADVFRFDPPGAAIAVIIYLGGSILALIGGFRGLRIIEALSLIAIPFLFNLLLAIGADWHMAELGAAVTAHAGLPFPAQVVIGRALTLWFIGEAILILISLVSVNRISTLGAHACVVCVERRCRSCNSSVRQCGAMGGSAASGDCVLKPMRGAGSSGLMGDRLSSDRRRSRLARWPAAALRGGLGTLADGLHQGRDLRRAVHGPNPDRGPDLERARRAVPA